MAEQLGVCAAYQCTRTGKPRSIVDSKDSWSCRLCDHHFATLLPEEKIKIAKETGRKA